MMVSELFFKYDKIHEFTDYLMEALKLDRPEEAQLQTRLLEVNLLQRTLYADEILQHKLFSHFDRNKIALLCEQKGLKTRAITLFDREEDIKRLLMKAHYVQNLFPQDVIV